MNWYCLRTAPQKEIALAEILRDQFGLSTFCPIETRWRRVPGTVRKRRPVTYAMLPRYMFVRCDYPWEIIRAHRHRGIQGVVGIDGRPAPISEQAIERLIRISGTLVPTNTAPIRRSFNVGDQVEIVSGPFRGHLVPIESINGRAARVLMQMLGGETEVEIPLDQLEAA